MSQTGIEFANRWVAENIQATIFAPDEGPHPGTEATLGRILGMFGNEDFAGAFLRERSEKMPRSIAAARRPAKSRSMRTMLTARRGPV